MRWAECWPALVDLRLSIALFNGRIPEASGALVDYDKRLASRPAYKRAAQATWPAAT
jgi:hypothetical protein